LFCDPLFNIDIVQQYITYDRVTVQGPALFAMHYDTSIGQSALEE